MERTLVSHLAHSDHPIAAPISDANLDRVLHRAGLPEDARILDLGCGEGGWTLRALELYPSAAADGVDISTQGLTATAQGAKERGLTDRLTLHHLSATDFSSPEPYDLVLCVGATHAYGGLAETMAAVGRFVRPGGLAVVGEGFWESVPTPEVQAVLGAEPDEYVDLAGTVERAERAGWATVYAHTSELGEWDDYEWSWTGTLARWALDHPGPDGDQVMAAALSHRDTWLTGYRGILGFVTLLLRATTH